MTIYKTLTQEKKEKDDPEYVKEPLTGKDVGVPPKVVRVTFGPNKSRTYINLCLVVAALMVLGAGIIGAIFLYKRLSHRVFIGQCGVTYYDEIYHQQADFLRGQQPKSFELNHEKFDNRFKIDSFNEYIEVSELRQYEKLNVPQFDECEETVVWHSFEQNLTAIVDRPRASCYIMQLNRTRISPPKDVMDLIKKLVTNSYSMPRMEVIREEYMVLEPPLQDLSNLGPTILSECMQYDTYRMERRPARLVRRRRDAGKEEIHVGFTNLKDSLLKLTLFKAV